MLSRRSASVLSAIPLLRASAPRRVAFGVALAAAAAALHFAFPPARLETLPSAALAPFVAIAALLGRRAGGLAALAVATLLIFAFNDPDPDPLQLGLFIGKWLIVVLIAGVAHDLWLQAADAESHRAEEARLAQQRLELALEAGAIGTFEVDLIKGEIRLNEKHQDICGLTGASILPLGALDEAVVVREDFEALQAARSRALSGAGRYVAKFRIRRANDQAIRWVESRGQTRFQAGAPVCVFGVTRDITDEMEAAAALEEKARLAEQDRLRAEELARERQRLELALEAGSIGAFEVDLLKGDMRLNEKHLEICGWTDDAPMPIGVMDDILVVEDDLAAVREARARALNETGRYVAKFRIRRASDQAIRWVETRGHVQFQDKAPVGVFGVTRDVTDEMEAAAALEEKARLAERLSALAEALPGAIYTYVRGDDGRAVVAYVSSNIERLLGFSPAAYARDIDGFMARVRPDDAARILAAAEVSARDLSVWHVVFRYHHPEKGEIWIEGDSQPARREDGAMVWHGYYQDVTARETAARALAESEARVRALKDERLAALEEKARLAEQLTLLAGALPGVIYTYVCTPEGRTFASYVSPNVADLLGYGADVYQMDLARFWERIHPEDVAAVARAEQASVRNFARWRALFRHDHPKKGEVWIEGDGQPVRREDGAIVVHGYLQDVTARETAARALAESEARVQALKDERLAALEEKARLAEQLTLLAGALPGVIYSYVRPSRGDGFFSYMSPNVERLLGFGPDAYRSDLTALFARVPAEDIPRMQAAEAASARTLRAWSVIFRYQHPQSGQVWIEGVGQPALREDGATVWHGYLLDVTAREISARALAESEARVRALKDERLDALEKMAARLAHEVNQPLAAAVTLLAVARRRLTPEPGRGARENATAETLDKAAHQLLRAGQIIARVREFSQHGEADKTFRSLHDTIRDALVQLEGDSSFAGFDIVVRLEAERDHVLIDRVQIAAVLVNLLRNAAQACPPDGRRTIVVATRNHGDAIEVSVIDYGSGLSEDARRHLFEFFWTTKGSGMGVGLAMSKAIVEAHYGAIWPQDETVEETVFTISLPLTESSEGCGDGR